MLHCSKKTIFPPRLLFAFGCLLAVLFTSCQPDPNDPDVAQPEMEKEILFFHAAFEETEIDTAKNQIILYENDDLEIISPEIEVSEGVTISPASGTAIDPSKPVTYTLTASDGTSTTYQLVVCRVVWDFWQFFSGGFQREGLGFYNFPWTATVQNSVLNIHIGASTESTLDLYLNMPSGANTYAVGNFSTSNIPANKFVVKCVYREDGIVKTMGSPYEGVLTITEIDAVKNTVSGSFNQINYTGTLTQAGGRTMLSGSFEDLPLKYK